MKKRVLNGITAILIAAATFISFTGCENIADTVTEAIGGGTKTSIPTNNVALIISPTANQHKPDIELAYNELYDSCYSYGYKSCIVDDGAPYLAFEGDLTNEDRPDGLSEQNKKLDAEAYVDDFIKKADGVQAVTSEKDTIKAIRLAADSLADCNGDKVIVLIDNGISTSGVAAFKSFKNFDVETCINAFGDNDYPDLTNISVVWYGLCDTVAPQNELNSDDMNNLQMFWEQYLEKCGSSSIKFSKNVAVNTTVDNSSLPWVSTVDVNPTNSKIPDFEKLIEQVEALPDEERDPTLDDALKEGIKLNETSVQFEPDSFELTDKEAAIKLMTPLTEYLKNNPDKKIILVATTATDGTNESCINFSKGRGEAIKEIFVKDMNVNSDQLLTVGLGFENEFHIPDLNPDGSLNDNAAKNRIVIFADVNSSIGKAYV